MNLGFAGRALWPALLLAALPATVPAQDTAPPPLEFMGLRPGASLSEVSGQLAGLGGDRMRCDRARRDPAVSECRARLFDPGTGRALELWLSAIDSLTSVITVSGPVTGEQLNTWKTTLEHDYGEVGARVQGPQWMMQWVRRGRMIRLTWRLESTGKVASVSLVDGHVLDDWGRRRGQP